MTQIMIYLTIISQESFKHVWLCDEMFPKVYAGKVIILIKLYREGIFLEILMDTSIELKYS